MPEPIIGRCSRCHDNTTFTVPSEDEMPLSDCCGAYEYDPEGEYLSYLEERAELQRDLKYDREHGQGF